MNSAHFSQSALFACKILTNLENLNVEIKATEEVIETYAQEHDINFFPKVGHTHDGLHVYGFGTLSISRLCKTISACTIQRQMGDCIIGATS